MIGTMEAPIALQVKGESIELFPRQSGDGLSNRAVDCLYFNAVTISLIPMSAGASCDMTVMGCPFVQGSYLALPDINASQTAIITARNFEVACGQPFAKVQLTNVVGVWNVVATAFFSPGLSTVHASISVNTLSAIQVKTGALTVQDVLTISTAGVIRSGQTAYNTGIGFWLEYNAGNPRLSLGDSGGQHLTWNGSILSITGSISATTGAIGGWTIGATSLIAGSGVNTVGLDSGGINPSIYAGNSNPALAPFQVSTSGNLIATAGTIGGWTLGATTITSTGVTLASGATAYVAFGTTPPTAPSIGTGVYIDKTGLFGINANTQLFKLGADGSGWLGSSAIFSWNTSGVVTMNGSAVMQGTITGGKTNYLNVPIIDGLVITNNTPLAGYVAWNSFVLTYQGTSYTIAVGNTNQKFIYWNKATSTTVLQTSATPPVQAGDQFIIVFNEAGSGIMAVFSNIVYADYISVGTLSAVQTNTGALSVTGALTVGTGGSIGSGQTAYNTGTGFWLEYNAGTPRFSIGNPAGNSLTWSGTVLSITGTITATSGAIGGWTLGATSLTAGSGVNTVGLDSGGINPAFYAGSATPASAPFRVGTSGTLVATSATITGAITATSGAINGPMTMSGATSSIAIGATPPSSATVGTGIWLDRTGMYGLSANTLEAKFDAVTGAITAGGGNVVLNNNGLGIIQGTGVANAVTWYSGATVIGNMSQNTSTGMAINLNSVSGSASVLHITASDFTGAMAASLDLVPLNNLWYASLGIGSRTLKITSVGVMSFNGDITTTFGGLNINMTGAPLGVGRFSNGVQVGSLVSTYGGMLTRYSSDVVLIGVPGTTTTQKLAITDSAGGGIANFYGDGSMNTNAFTASSITTTGSFLYLGKGTPANVYLAEQTDSREWWVGVGMDAGGDDKWGVYDKTAAAIRLKIDTAGNIAFPHYGAGTLVTDASGNITASSDERLKTILGPFNRGLDALMGIQPILHKWNKDSGMETAGIYAGFSAQNLKQCLPEAVGEAKGGWLSLMDRPIIAALVNAIQEHEAIIVRLQEELGLRRN